MDQPQEITALLREWSDGHREALDDLLPLVYNELHKQARRYLRRERQDHTLQTTALIHEAFEVAMRTVEERTERGHSRAELPASELELNGDLDDQDSQD